MYDARGRFEWGQTSQILALIYNVNRDPKKNKAVNPNDLNPFAPKAKPLKVSQDKMKSILTDLFGKPKESNKCQ